MAVLETTSLDQLSNNTCFQSMAKLDKINRCSRIGSGEPCSHTLIRLSLGITILCILKCILIRVCMEAMQGWNSKNGIAVGHYYVK